MSCRSLDIRVWSDLDRKLSLSLMPIMIFKLGISVTMKLVEKVFLMNFQTVCTFRLVNQLTQEFSWICGGFRTKWDLRFDSISNNFLLQGKGRCPWGCANMQNVESSPRMIFYHCPLMVLPLWYQGALLNLLGKKLIGEECLLPATWAWCPGRRDHSQSRVHCSGGDGPAVWWRGREPLPRDHYNRRQGGAG